MSYRLLTLAALLVLLPAAARAAVYKPFGFHPEKNDGVVVDVIVDGGSSCTHNFGEGPGYTFTGIRVEREPENGKLIKTGANRFTYTTDKGFIGKDAYIFKICASKRAQKGCSTVAFVSQAARPLPGRGVRGR
jgi:hypothetical protein